MASRREARFGFEHRTLDLDVQAAIRDRLPMTRSRQDRLGETSDGHVAGDLPRPHDLGSRFRVSFGGVRLPD